MPSATSHGYPYPLGSDDLADTDLHIKALADFLQSLWANDPQPYCALEASAATSLTNSAWTKINLATTVHNDTAYFSVSSSVITVLQAGIYSVNAWALGPSSSGVVTGATISKNGLPGAGGASNITQNLLTSASNFAGSSLTPTRLYFPLAANATIQLSMYQASGSAQNTAHTAGSQVAALTLIKVG